MIPGKEEWIDLPTGGKITETGMQFVSWTVGLYLAIQLGYVQPTESWWPEGWER